MLIVAGMPCSRTARRTSISRLQYRLSRHSNGFPVPNWVLRTAIGPAKLAGVSSPTQ
jgi:hypothetical protein